MTDHPHQLYTVNFMEADQARLAGFSCGDEAWSRCATEWIQGSDVLDSMKRGRRSGYLRTREAKSLASVRWGERLGVGRPQMVRRLQSMLIPMVGLATSFHRQPPDPDWRYAKQVMSHLINAAREISHLINAAREISHETAAQSAKPAQWLVLMVHRDNQYAIRCYEKCGFELIPDVVRRNDHLVMKLWIGESES